MEETNIITQINNSTFYAKFSNFYVDHNLNSEQTETLLKDLDVGSWILWNYSPEDYSQMYIGSEDQTKNNITLNAITIKINDGFIHHKKFIFMLHDKLDDVIEVNMFNKQRKTYKTMKDYLEKLSKIYGLDLDKQIIYEDD